MTASFTFRFRRQYQQLSVERQAKFDKQFTHEPSTSLRAKKYNETNRAKKYNETNDIWQARVDDGYRFYFQVDGETYLLPSIIPHPK